MRLSAIAWIVEIVSPRFPSCVLNNTIIDKANLGLKLPFGNSVQAYIRYPQ